MPFDVQNTRIRVPCVRPDVCTIVEKVKEKPLEVKYLYSVGENQADGVDALFV